MTITILSTKLQIPPLRADLVARRRLLDQLAASLRQGRKLTVVSAPAGFGKTTLVIKWLAEAGRPAAWISLDENDNDLYRFWRYVIHALQRIDRSIGETILHSLDTARPNAEAIVSALINDLVAAPRFDDAGPAILVLDDYHLIESAEIHDSLNFLLDNQPSQLHIVLTTRADPALNLARRRARLALTEIRAGDLRFSAAEAAIFLNETMQLALSEDEIQTLERRTEGWAVGLQLAALSLRDQPNRHEFINVLAGDDRYIGDYLMEEVIHHQPAQIEEFLIKSSILGRLNGSLCVAVTGMAESQALLERLERDNLFVAPLDRRRQWFRYHRLFADLLQRQLHRQVDGATMADLHRRASGWYEANDFAEEAIQHAIAAADPGRVADLIEKFALSMRFERGIAIPRAWMQTLPATIYQDRPMLAAIHAESLMYLPDMSALADAGHWLDKADAALRRADESEEEVRQIRGYIAALRSTLAIHRGEGHEQLLPRVEEAIALLPDIGWAQGKRAVMMLNRGITFIFMGRTDEAERALIDAIGYSRRVGAHFALIMAVYGQYVLCRARGDFSTAAQICQSLLEELRDEADRIPAIGALWLSLATIQFEWNQLEAAQHNLERGLATIPLSGEYGIEMNGYVTLARVHLARGDEREAERALARFRRVWQGVSKLLGEDYPTLIQIRLWQGRPISAADFESFKQWADSVEPLPPATNGALLGNARRDYTRLIGLASVRLRQHRAGEAVDLAPILSTLARQREQSEAAGWFSQVIDIAILEALLWQSLGQEDKARQSLEVALRYAAPAGYVRSFVEEGEPMRRLLESAQDQTRFPDAVRRLLAAFPVQMAAPAPSPASPSPVSALIEPLNDREEEILRLLAQKRSRQEIAEALILSINTVKWHINNLYAKLGVDKRGDAIARAVELGIL